MSQCSHRGRLGEETIEDGRETSLVFIDQGKAFNGVNKDLLW